MTSNQKKICYVQFQLYQETINGEEIHITGNIPSLGQWDVYKSEKMITNKKDYPTWKSRENIVAQQDTEIQYKYVIFYNKKFKCWENHENRRVKIGKFYKVVIKDPGSQITNSVSDQNLSNISNSEISKTENQFNELIAANEIDFTNLNNDILFSEINNNTIINEEQFILSNKKNEFILPNVEKDKSNKELNAENTIFDLNEDFRTNIEFNDININDKDNDKKEINFIDNNIKNIINEITPINSQIFNNVLKDDLIEEDFEKNDDFKNLKDKKELINEIHNNSIYNKIIMCTFYLPIEINDDKINLLSDYIYPNLFQLYKNNKNIYFIGFLKNSKKLPEKNKEELLKKLKTEYRMYPIEIDEEFYQKLIKYFNEFATPFLNNVQVSITNIKNKDINSMIEETHLKFNEIVYKKIIEIANEEKFLLVLFDYYFMFVPKILRQNIEEKFYRDIGIQYIFLNKICSKDRFIKIPYYKNIIESVLNSNIIVFPSYYNCYNFLNLTKLLNEFKYKVNVDGDIIMDINLNEDNKTNFNHKLYLKVENIFPDYQMLKSIYNENQLSLNFKDIEQIITNIKKKENHFIFLSIDDIKYLPFIKIKIFGIKSFLENILDEKYKITFIQVITGEYNPKKEKTNNINSNININEEKKELEKDDNYEVHLAEIVSIINEINSCYENKVIELIHRDINLYEKLFLLSNADCFVKTFDDINSPFFIYEFLMAKLIQLEKQINKDEKNSSNNEIINEKEISDFPIVEYIIGNQIKEIPGLNEYILINPYEIKNIDLELQRAFRNLYICHKNTNLNWKEHSKNNDFIYVKKYFDIEKIHFYKFNDEEENQISTKEENTINENEKLSKINIDDIIKDYEETIKSSNNDENKPKDKIFKIVAINLDYFFFDENFKDKESDINKKLYLLFSIIISLALKNKNNKILLYSNKDQSELDIIINNYIEENEQKYESSFLLLNNIIIASVGGYSFKKISNYKKEGENHWIKFRLDLEEYPYSEKEILNILTSYKENCSNIKIEQKSNKIYVYNDDCNKDQVDLYMDDFKNIINNDENFKNFLVINKIKNGYCITNILNYKALFISKIIKEVINSGKKPKLIIFFGFNKTDEILYNYLDIKKSIIEKHIKEEAYIYCIKLIKNEKDCSENKKNDDNIICDNKKYNSLYYSDDIEETISLLENFVDLENKDSKKSN